MRASDALCGFFRDPPDMSPASDSALWASVKIEAERHGVAPLVAFAVRPHLQRQERAWCDQVLQRSWRSHDYNLRRLDHINRVLKSAGVSAMALKGPVLACRHYSPAFLRKASGDLDLAVREEDLQGACEALMQEGYTMRSTIKATKRFSHHVVLVSTTLPPVELHFRLSSGVAGIPVSELFARSLEYVLPGGSTIRVPGEADEIMHLILHLVQDRFVTLFLFQEVRRIWRSTSPEARIEAVRRAMNHGFRGVMTLADVAFRSRWSEPLIPEQISVPGTWLKARVNESLYRAMESNSELKAERTMKGRLSGRWSDLQVTDSPLQALRTAWSALMTLRA